MEKEMQTDYQQWDRVWQRVAPQLDPYPEVRQAMVVQSPAKQERHGCLSEGGMGQAELIRGFIEDELEDRRTYLAYARCAPNTEGRRVLRQLAMEEQNHARRLMGIYYIMTGECYQPVACTAKTELLPWCHMLRHRYHGESYGAHQYHRVAQETQDVCLHKIFLQFSEDESRHAAALLRLLEGNLLA